MKPADSLKLPHRVVHLPLAFNERWTNEAVGRYMRSVRSEAPYLPSNVKFIAANNGEGGRRNGACMLGSPCAGPAAAGASARDPPPCRPRPLTPPAALFFCAAGLEGDPVEAVRKIVFEASYMVMGLGEEAERSILPPCPSVCAAELVRRWRRAAAGLPRRMACRRRRPLAHSRRLPRLLRLRRRRVPGRAVRGAGRPPPPPGRPQVQPRPHLHARGQRGPGRRLHVHREPHASCCLSLIAVLRLLPPAVPAAELPAPHTPPVCSALLCCSTP